jgi:hypothetical protein
VILPGYKKGEVSLPVESSVINQFASNRIVSNLLESSRKTYTPVANGLNDGGIACSVLKRSAGGIDYDAASGLVCGAGL